MNEHGPKTCPTNFPTNGPWILFTGDTRVRKGEEQIRTVFFGADVWLPVEELHELYPTLATR